MIHLLTHGESLIRCIGNDVIDVANELIFFCELYDYSFVNLEGRCADAPYVSHKYVIDGIEVWYTCGTTMCKPAQGGFKYYKKPTKRGTYITTCADWMGYLFKDENKIKKLPND